MNIATRVINILDANSTKLKIVPHPGNSDPENFKKFHAIVGDEKVATFHEIGKCPITHVPQPGYRVKMETPKTGSTREETHARTKKQAVEWINRQLIKNK